MKGYEELSGREVLLLETAACCFKVGGWSERKVRKHLKECDPTYLKDEVAWAIEAALTLNRERSRTLPPMDVKALRKLFEPASSRDLHLGVPA